jgi:hypothetical protein
MNHATCVVTPMDPELIQVCNAAGQGGAVARPD